MKRRPQAQRKFAQGAVIPRQHLRNEEKRSSEASTSNADSRVVQVNTSATTMLDMVSFKGIHPIHLEPFVVLKRISCLNSESPTRTGLRRNVKRNVCADLSSSQPQSIHKKKRRGRRRAAARLQSQPNPMETETDEELLINYKNKNSEEAQVTKKVDQDLIESSTCVETDEPEAGPSDWAINTFGAEHDVPDHESQGGETEVSMELDVGEEPMSVGNITINSTEWYGKLRILEHGGELVEATETVILEPMTSKEIGDDELAISCNSVCPAGSLVSMKQIVCISDNILSRLCNKCKECDKVNSILKILKYIENKCYTSQQSSARPFGADISTEDVKLFIDLTNADEDDGGDTSSNDYINSLNDIKPEIKALSSMIKLGSSSSEAFIRGTRNNTHESQENNSNFLSLLQMIGRIIHEEAPSTVHVATSTSASSVETANLTRDTNNTNGDTENNTDSICEANESMRYCSLSGLEENSDFGDAPTFNPTEEEFKDPLGYFLKIRKEASKYGLCKVVAPSSFKPACVLGDNMRFDTANNYIARMFNRWGRGSQELTAIRTYLASQGVSFNRPPLLQGIQVNLPKLYHTVQDFGGLKSICTKQQWRRVADLIGFTKLNNPQKRLDHIYVKFLLPYETMSETERNELIRNVDRLWQKKYEAMLNRASNPLQRQKRILEENEISSDEEYDDEETRIVTALSEVEDCVIPDRAMNLTMFKKVAMEALEVHFELSKYPSVETVEETYWDIVLQGREHVSVNSASIDTAQTGYGFPKDEKDPYSTHSWNLKNLSDDPANILRSLGPVVGVTVPTLHLEMVFSTSCWHRDPHGLPWIEYMHEGAEKIWYGIPNEESDKFRQAVEKLCPTFCQNKSIWLPSDIAMIPPRLLHENDVKLCRATQKPGEFIIVYPKAYSCSIATGFTVSESVYFATYSWIENVHKEFQKVRESYEPTMFSLEHLLISLAKDEGTAPNVLLAINSPLKIAIDTELENRRSLRKLGLRGQIKDKKKSAPSGAWNVRDQDECQACSSTLYLSRVTGILGKNTAMCPEHALRVLRQRDSRVIKDIHLELFYSTSELEDIIRVVNQRIANLSAN